jgi:hypothetical protein
MLLADQIRRMNHNHRGEQHLARILLQKERERKG